MIEFPKMPSSKGFRHNTCVAFEKLDGTNVGATWSAKRGFHKFRLRRGLFDQTDKTFGPAIPMFMATYAEPLSRIFAENFLFRGDRQTTVFFEFHGPDTFAGNHFKREVTLFDIWKDDFGFIGPDEFIKLTQGIKIARPVYRGKFTGQLTQDVREGKYGVVEGVVVKAGKGGDDYEVCKIKTYAYLEKLKQVFGKDWEQFGE